MTINQYRGCIAEVFAYAERDFFVSDLALSEIWGDAPEGPIPDPRLAALGLIWEPRTAPSRRSPKPPVSATASWRSGLAFRTAPSRTGRPTAASLRSTSA